METSVPFGTVYGVSRGEVTTHTSPFEGKKEMTNQTIRFLYNLQFLPTYDYRGVLSEITLDERDAIVISKSSLLAFTHTTPFQP